MNLLKNKYVRIGLAFTGGILLYSFIKKFTDKKPQVLESLDPPQEENETDTPSSTTPVSGTSDSILNEINQDQANDLKEELK